MSGEQEVRLEGIRLENLQDLSLAFAVLIYPQVLFRHCGCQCLNSSSGDATLEPQAHIHDQTKTVQCHHRLEEGTSTGTEPVKQPYSQVSIDKDKDTLAPLNRDMHRAVLAPKELEKIWAMAS